MDLLHVAIFAIAAGLAIGAVVVGFSNAILAGGEERRLRVRLRNELNIRPTSRAGKTFLESLSRLGERVAGLLISDEEGRKQQVRRELVKAGIYSTAAVRLVVSIRIVLLMLGIALGWAVALAFRYDWLMCVPLGGLAGYMLPRIWISRRIRQNHRLLERALPDGLDLMVICVEAGLTMDAAIQRVAEELHLAHPSLARELSICNMETRIGLPRAVALKNLGTRSGYGPLQGVTAMLVQTDRFGTSIAASLRVQADSIRKQRQHRAEEAAAKASVKLSFPLVLFIFPASFLVLAGPMIVNFMINGFFGGE